MRLLNLFLLSFLSIFSFSQNNDHIDKLLSKLKTTNDDAKKIEILISIGETYYESNTDEAKKYLELAAQLAVELKNSSAIADITILRGKLLEKENNYEQAKQNYELALAYYIKLHDQKKIAEVSSKLGVINTRQGNYTEGEKLNLKALSIYKSEGNKKHIAGTYNNLGIIYEKQSLFELARDYYFKAYELKKELSDLSTIASSENNIGNIYCRLSQYDKAIHFIEKSIESEFLSGDSTGAANAMNNLGVVYEKKGAYDKAFSLYFDALATLEQSDHKTGLINCMINIGNLYKSTNENEKALEFYGRALNEAQHIDDKLQEAYILNNMGGMYLNTKQYEKALVNYRLSYTIKKGFGDKNGLAVSGTSMGHVYLAQEKCDTALVYFNEALFIYETTGDLFGKADLLVSMGTCYSLLKKFDKAEQLLLQAFEIAKTIHSIQVITKVTNELSNLFATTRDTKQELHYYKLYSIYRDSLFNNDKQKIIEDAQARYDVAEKEKQITLLEKDNELKKSRLYVMVAVLVSVVVFALFIAVVTVLLIFKRNKDRQIYRMSEQIMTKELDYNKEQIRLYAQRLIDKNNLITVLSEQIKELNLNDATKNNALEEKIGDLLSFKILTDADWEKFKTHFEAIYPGLIFSLRTKYPELTSAEQRLFLLSKLKFETQEIAGILGISTESVRKARYRLKKKLNLIETEDMEEYIFSFG